MLMGSSDRRIILFGTPHLHTQTRGCQNRRCTHTEDGLLDGADEGSLLYLPVTIARPGTARSPACMHVPVSIVQRSAWNAAERW